MFLHQEHLGRKLTESLLAFMLAAALGVTIALTSDSSTKYQIAAVIGAVGFVTLSLMPERRIACVILWVLIHPLSIEKVFYINAPIGPQFIDQAIVVNASDVILLLLLFFLLAEVAFKRERVFYWPEFATYQSMLIIWATVSYAIHSVYLQDGLDTVAPLALIHYIRTLFFMVLLYSAIRSRGDVITVLLAILVIVMFESVLVGLSYTTGERFSFTKLTGTDPDLSVQTFSGSDGKEVRGVGTLGHTNQQAYFHTLFTLPLIALFMVRRTFWRYLSLIGITGSLFAIVLTFSRTAWMSVVLAMILIFVVSLHKHLISKTAWLTGALMAVVMTVALGALAEPILNRITKGDDGATDSRLRMIALAFDLYASNPILGVGPGEFSEATLKYYPPGFKENEWVATGDKAVVPTVGRLEVARVEQPGKDTLTAPLPVHNKYLLTLSELGVFGLLIYLGIYLSFFKSARRCSHSKDPLYKMLGITGLGVVLASLSYMSLDLFADDKSIEVLMFCPLFVAAASRCAESQARNGDVVRSQHPDQTQGAA
jgi:O-antigen ligase